MGTERRRTEHGHAGLKLMAVEELGLAGGVEVDTLDDITRLSLVVPAYLIGAGNNRPQYLYYAYLGFATRGTPGVLATGDVTRGEQLVRQSLDTMGEEGKRGLMERFRAAHRDIDAREEGYKRKWLGEGDIGASGEMEAESNPLAGVLARVNSLWEGKPILAELFDGMIDSSDLGQRAFPLVWSRAVHGKSDSTNDLKDLAAWMGLYRERRMRGGVRRHREMVIRGRRLVEAAGMQTRFRGATGGY